MGGAGPPVKGLWIVELRGVLVDFLALLRLIRCYGISLRSGQGPEKWLGVALPVVYKEVWGGGAGLNSGVRGD